MITVTIIVPVYNVERYLSRCMDSLLAQTLQDIEIILVDDGSSDHCPDMCDEYAQRYSFVKVVHKQNAGLGMACNSGLEIASGKYVAFCDSDDWVAPEMYETMYRVAEDNGADMVFTGLQRIDENGNITQMKQPIRMEVIRKHDDVLDLGMSIMANPVSVRQERKLEMSAKVVLYRNSKIRDNALRFVSERQLISEDLIWNLDNIAHAECVCCIPQTFYFYFDNSASLTNTLKSTRFDSYKKLHQELQERLTRSAFPPEALVRNDRLFIGYCRHSIVRTFEPHVPASYRRKYIRTICSDPIWKEIRLRYPVAQMPLLYRVFLQMIMCRTYWGITLFVKLMRLLSTRKKY